MKLKHLLPSLLSSVSLLSAATLTEGWDSSIDFGLTLTRGNSDTTLITTSLAMAKTEGQIEYNAGLAYAFGEEEGSVLTDELTGFLNLNKLISEKDYYGFRIEGRRDDIAEIDYRVQLSALAGTYLIKSEKTTLALEAGPGITFESLDGEDATNAHIYLGEKFTQQITSNTKITQSLGIYSNVEDLDDYNFIFAVGIETMMNKSLSLKVSLENKYESQPADDAKRNDLRLISGVSYKF